VRVAGPPAGRRFPPLLTLTFSFFPRGDLTEADVSLSASGLSRVAAAVLEAFQLYPVILHEQANFLGPGLRAVQIGEKGPGTGTGLAFLTHAHDSFRLPLGFNNPGVTGDHAQFHAVVQLFLGGVFGAFEGARGHRHSSSVLIIFT
jgi:hypothetical protein